MLVKFKNDIQLECLSAVYVTNDSLPYIKIDLNVSDLSPIKSLLDEADFSNVKIYTEENGLFIGEYNGFTQHDFSASVLGNFTMDATIILKQESLQSKVDSIEQAMNATTIRINDLENANKIDVEDMTLNEYKDYKQDLNKQALYEFLAKSSITYNDKEYGVSEEDQNEMAMNMIIYQLYQKLGIPSILEWYAKKEQCSTFTEEEFTTLIVKMKSFVYPYIQYCQAIKAQIYACETKDGVSNISFDYNTYVPPITNISTEKDANKENVTIEDK